MNFKVKFTKNSSKVVYTSFYYNLVLLYFGVLGMAMIARTYGDLSGYSTKHMTEQQEWAFWAATRNKQDLRPHANEMDAYLHPEPAITVAEKASARKITEWNVLKTTAMGNGKKNYLCAVPGNCNADLRGKDVKDELGLSRNEARDFTLAKGVIPQSMTDGTTTPFITEEDLGQVTGIIVFYNPFVGHTDLDVTAGKVPVEEAGDTVDFGPRISLDMALDTLVRLLEKRQLKIHKDIPVIRSKDIARPKTGTSDKTYA